MARAQKIVIPGIGGKSYPTIQVQVGGIMKYHLIERLQETRSFGSYIGDAMRRRSFVILEQKRTVTFAYAQLYDVGFAHESEIKTSPILDAERLKSWSEQNLRDGWRFGVGHISYGPSVGLLKLPVERPQTLWVATKRLHGTSAESHLACLRRDSTGKFWIDCERSADNQTWDPEDMFLFTVEQKRRR